MTRVTCVFLAVSLRGSNDSCYNSEPAQGDAFGRRFDLWQVCGV